MTMKSMVFDLETIANPAMIEHLPEPNIDGRIKDPAKIVAQRDEKRKQQIEKMGLDKATALICCATVLDVETKACKSIALDPETLNEKELLESFWEIAYAYERFVTFNGLWFDVPMLTFRSMVNEVMPAAKISTARYQIANHIDMRALLGGWDSRANGTLDFYARAILGEGKAGEVDGSFVQSMWDCGCVDEIAEYNAAECQTMLKLYERMQHYYY